MSEALQAPTQLLIGGRWVDGSEGTFDVLDPATGEPIAAVARAGVPDMTAAVDFDESYADPDSHVQAQDRAAGWRPRRLDDPSDGYTFLRSLRGGSEHGRAFQYCSATTDVLAWVLERATGRRYPDLLSDHLWAQLGAEHVGILRRLLALHLDAALVGALPDEWHQLAGGPLHGHGFPHGTARRGHALGLPAGIPRAGMTPAW